MNRAVANIGILQKLGGCKLCFNFCFSNWLHIRHYVSNLAICQSSTYMYKFSLSYPGGRITIFQPSQISFRARGHPPYSAALTSHANVCPRPAIIKILADALKSVFLSMFYARPILELLLATTRVILVERADGNFSGGGFKSQPRSEYF
jgi:hypothetical protein